jgi:hypothetical protein
MKSPASTTDPKGTYWSSMDNGATWTRKVCPFTVAGIMPTREALERLEARGARRTVEARIMAQLPSEEVRPFYPRLTAEQVYEGWAS